MRGRAPWLGVLAALGAVGCSSDSATGPTTVERFLSVPGASEALVGGTTLTFVSGESGEPATGAKVLIGGQEHRTDAQGQIVVPEPVPGGTFLDVAISGFLDRQTRAASGQTRHELWPADSPTRLDTDYTRALVYASAGVDTEGALEPLERPSLDSGRVALVPSEEILRDVAAVNRLHGAAAEMTEALGGAIVYGVGADPSAVRVELRVDPNEESIRDNNFRAVARCWRRDFTITRCEVLFRSIDVARSGTTLHELGHTFGLNHSPDRSEIMGVLRIRTPDHFSSRERLAMRLMLKRRPGNVFPDNDREVLASRAVVESTAIVCGHP